MKQPRVGVVGAGRVGTVLAARFLRAGHPVVGVSARSAVSRTRAAALIPTVPIASPAEIAADCDILVLAVPDDELSQVVNGLATDVRPGQIVFHTSGRHGLAVLASMAERGAVVLALHPAMTFTGTELDIDRECVFGVTAAARHRDIAETIVSTLRGTPVVLDEADRSGYHAALAHGANHLTTVVNQAMDMLRNVGVEDPAALLRPLLEAALDNTLSFGDDALTGPVVRGDVETVRAHLAAIKDHETAASYAQLARSTADRAVRAGRLAEDTADSIAAAVSPEVAR